MNLNFNTQLATSYTSNSQIARVLTENWVAENSFCPGCGEPHLTGFKNNKPVADFYCNICNEEFELKSKHGKLSGIINDGAYNTMIKRINASNNPNFFFLAYAADWSVVDFLIVPKQFFTEEVIIQRKPLSSTARRANWVGCNIDLNRIVDSGKVYIVRNKQLTQPSVVKESFARTLFLREKQKEAKGWILDIMQCVDSLHKSEFTLDEVYRFEAQLKQKYPDNNFIKDKIRQQLQVLRDRGFIEFTKRGMYKKIVL